jgi:hypothetical protein
MHVRPLILLLSLLPTLAQGLIRVPQDVDSIQTALDLAMDGDTVVVGPGTWHEQLHIGSGCVTLCSNYIFSQDSADIVTTVLDGQFLGTILTVDMNPTSYLELNGLSFTRGLGTFIYEPEDQSGGAVDIIRAGTVQLHNLVFYNNHSPVNGSALYFIDFGWPSHSHFYIDNVNCYNNTHGDIDIAGISAFSVYYAKVIDARKLRISIAEPTLYTQYRLRASDSLMVKDCVFTGLDQIRSVPIGFNCGNTYNYCNYMRLENIIVSHNTFQSGGGFGVVMGHNGFLDMKNIHVNNNYFPNGGMVIDISGYSDFIADSLFICHNTSAKSYALFNSTIPGTMSNLFVIGNHMGSPGRFTPTWPGQNGIVKDLSINGAIYADNVLERSMAPPGQYTSGGHLLRLEGHVADSLFYRNMRFINNLHIDPDVYVFEDLYNVSPGPNFGRLIDGIYDVMPQYLELDSCVFISNRQPNIIPEVEPINLPGGSIYIGSNVQISTGSGSFTRVIRNIQMIDCDDGGIVIGKKGSLLVNNVTIIDNKRSGMSIGNNDSTYSTNISNIYISRIQQQESYTSHPYNSCIQDALSFAIRPNHESHVTNITIEGCDLPFIMRNAPNYPPLVLRNSLFHQNAFIQFENPNGDPVLFEHCLLPVDRPGIGNLVSVDPLFDDLLGSPWLSPLSPCIDAGDPDPRWNDREDPATPGFALWPSQGTLRNDMGFTGGPHAALYDTTWTHLPTWEPKVRPRVFSLGAPWPNPFNPVAWVPVTLASPAAFTLAVYNLLGQQVGLLHQGPLHAGTHVFPLEARSLASGTYIVVMTCAGRAESRAVTLLR